MSRIGKEIKRLREERGWSQAELAVYAGSSQPTVNQIESGKRNPSTQTLEKLAGALEVEVADFFPKGQASLPFEDDQRRFLPYVRPWFLTLDRLTRRLEKLASPGEFNAGEFLASGEQHRDIMAGLNMLLRELESRGMDPMTGVVGEELRESMLRLASALRISSGAAIKALSESDLARFKQRRTEAQAELEGLPDFEKEVTG